MVFILHNITHSWQTGVILSTVGIYLLYTGIVQWSVQSFGIVIKYLLNYN